jgi:hypothetical protein
MTIDTELSDFNWRYLSQYGRIKFYVAARFWDAMTFDKAPIDPYRLACEFYARHGFAVEAKDPYIDGNRVRHKSVDDLVKENPEKLSDAGQMLYDGWLGFKKKLDADRKKEPELPTKIELPPPEPPKTLPKPKVDPWATHPNSPSKPMPNPEKPKGLPEVKVPQEKKNPAPWLVRFSMIFGIVSTVAGAVAWFYPPIKVWLLAIVPIVESLLKMLGV